MSGKGGKGLGKAGIKSHRKLLRDSSKVDTRPLIQRLARIGVVKLISDIVYEYMRRIRLALILARNAACTQYANRARLSCDAGHDKKLHGHGCSPYHQEATQISVPIWRLKNKENSRSSNGFSDKFLPNL